MIKRIIKNIVIEIVIPLILDLLEQWETEKIKTQFNGDNLPPSDIKKRVTQKINSHG